MYHYTLSGVFSTCPPNSKRSAESNFSAKSSSPRELKRANRAALSTGAGTASSIAALTGGITGPHYAASKAGLHGLTHFLASRVAASGVTVNAIAPALIEETGMFPGDPKELIRKVPVGRLGTPRDVADLAVAVLRNGYLTNQVLSIDGGMHPR